MPQGHHGHNIKKLWEDNIPPNYKELLSDSVNKAFCILDANKVLKNEQLFRYYAEKDRNNNILTALKSLPAIKYEDFHALSEAVLGVRRAILCCIHLKKGLPEKDDWCYLIKESQ